MRMIRLIGATMLGCLAAIAPLTQVTLDPRFLSSAAFVVALLMGAALLTRLLGGHQVLAQLVQLAVGVGFIWWLELAGPARRRRRGWAR